MEPESPCVGLQLAVFHRTAFYYQAPVTQSINSLHLEPRTFPYQKTLRASISIMPQTRVKRFTDLFQNITHHFELLRAHTKLEIESRIEVHNLPLDISQASREAQLAAYQDSSIREIVWPFLKESRWVSNTPEIWHKAVDVTLGYSTIYEQATALMSWIYHEFTYDPAATNVNTHLNEAFELRRGVCQDFTHVMLGLCRSIGIASRYASGYLYNGPKDILVGAQASHAWVEIYLPQAGWIGFDPTNNTLADERYVKIAVGRDYDDVAPVRGTYHGTGNCRMEVTVEVERI